MNALDPFCLRRDQLRGSNSMQAKWIKLYLPLVHSGKPPGLSLKAACQVSSQATAYVVQMFWQDGVAFEWKPVFPYLCSPTSRRLEMRVVSHWGWLAYQLFSEYKLGRLPISRVASCQWVRVLYRHILQLIFMGHPTVHYFLFSRNEIWVNFHFWISIIWAITGRLLKIKKKGKVVRTPSGVYGRSLSLFQWCEATWELSLPPARTSVWRRAPPQPDGR